MNPIRKLSIALMLMLASAFAAAQDIPRDEKGFTEAVAERLRKEVAGAAVSIKGPLTISFGELQVNLDRIFKFCGANPQGCASEVDTYVKGAAQIARDRSAPPTKETVRPVVRSARYVQIARQTSPDIQPRALVDDLVILPALVFPRTIRLVTERDNKALGLTADEVFQLALANLDKELKPLMEVAKPAGRAQIGQLVGDTFHPSRLIQHSNWAPLAEAQGGTLIVTAPATDTVLYVGESTPVAIDALRAFARELSARAPNPLSDTLLRWTPSGWEAVK